MQGPNGPAGISGLHFQVREEYIWPTHFTLYWQSGSPKHSGDFDTYIWQRYRKPPPFEFVKFHITAKNRPRSLKMILLFHDKRSLGAFRTQHQEHISQRLSTRVAGEAWSPAAELVTSTSALFRLVLSEMVQFLRSCSKEVTRLVCFANTNGHNLGMIAADERDRHSTAALILVLRRSSTSYT